MSSKAQLPSAFNHILVHRRQRQSIRRKHEVAYIFVLMKICVLNAAIPLHVRTTRTGLQQHVFDKTTLLKIQ